MSKRNLNILLLISLIITTITAWNSSGYFHADEHYQIIEASGSIVGWNEKNQLAWEFNEQIRPSLQPWLGAIILKPLTFFGLKDPFQLAFVLRWFMGLVTIVALRFFYNRTSKFYVKDEKTEKIVLSAYLVLLLFSWFIPFLSVRFSSETASAVAFLIGLALLYTRNESSNSSWSIGIWFGIAFFLRFQIAFGLIGLLIWFVLFKKYKSFNLLKIAAGFFIILFVNVGLDSFFYGNLVFTPWNYFEANILHGVASSFGESSWIYYMKEGFYLPTTIVSSIVCFSLLYNVFFNFKSPVLWFFILYVLGHLLISHKEERFLFPLAFLFPYFIFTALLGIKNKWPKFQRANFLIWIPASIQLVILVVSFPVMSLESCGLGRTKIIEYINYKHPEKVTFIRPWYANPYNPWEGLPQNFYAKLNLVDIRVDNTKQFVDTLTHFHGTILVCVSESNLLIDNYKVVLEENGFKQVERSVSELKYKLDSYTKGINKSSVLYLYEKKQ